MSRRSMPSFAQLALDDDLGGDARVIHAGEPERLVPLHPRAADQHVLRACAGARGRRAGAR